MSRQPDMEKTIRMRTIKDPAPKEQRSLLKLKGSLISRGYTQIIHIQDQDQEFHLNTFETQQGRADEVRRYIAGFITDENLLEAVTINS